eukprot:TRINITY_DN2_c0_g2_i1.p1 TRINITY_DN2_c0_g2~~TRINITY_DN2_c0_g2_i1.p1  ORF type:complete len:781 (-),score=55.16 TRINITY_DN2_c0_g2_i1:112-2454(-)
MSRLRSILPFKLIFATLTTYFQTYPSIKEKTDLCAYYRKYNKSFPLSFLMVVIAVLLIQATRLAEAVFIGKSLTSLWSMFKVFSMIDLALMGPLFYWFNQLYEIKSVSRKRDFLYHTDIRTKIRIFAIIPTFIFTLAPLMMSNSPKPADVTGVSWLFCFVVQLYVCTWIVDDVRYKTAFMAVFNIGYCLSSIYKGFFALSTGTQFTTPVILAVVFFVAFDRHVKENFILKRRIKQQKNMYEKHLEKYQDPIIILNRSQVLFSNAANDEKFANSVETFFRKATFMVTDNGESLKENITNRLAEQAQISETVTQIKCHLYDDASDIISSSSIYNISITESMSFSGEKIVSLSLHDMTHETRQEQTRAECKYKNILLFSLSHELRTPLNIFQAFLDVSKPAMTSKELLELHKSAKGAWRYLRNKINDILDYAQMLTEEFILHKSTFSLGKFVNQLMKATNCLLGKKRTLVRLEFSVDKTLADEFEGDPERLEQVLFNFLSNAEKNITSGTISLKVYPAECGKRMVTFEVTDTGCGMSTDTLASLFEMRNVQNKQSEKKSNGLGGLGLTISKMICNRMGTDIKVSSILSKGSTFSFTLPAPPPFDESRLVSESSVPEDNATARLCHKTKISRKKQPRFLSTRFLKRSIPAASKGEPILIVVDDTQLNRFVVKNMVQRYKVSVIEAENGKDALDKLDWVLSFKERLGKIIIFMDLNMPIMDGIEATFEIRRRQVKPKPHIVALTAFSSECERAKCMEAGMDGFISKPLTKESLNWLFANLKIRKR